MVSVFGRLLTRRPWLAALVLLLAACAPAAPTTSPPASNQVEPSGEVGDSLTIYSGRVEALVGPVIERFKEQTGIDVRVRYGDTAELAAAILEEGRNSPADVFFAQDAGGLGALARRDRFVKLPDNLLDPVDARLRSPQGEWVGVSGRARTVIYNTQALSPGDLPESIHGFTDPHWRGKIGWAPTNGSFQAFVTALRVTEGDETARRWLEGIQANQPKAYRNNTAIVQAVGTGEVEVGFVNHYYLFNFLREQGEGFPARNYHPPAGDSGAMINVAGVGILATSQNPRAAERLVEFLLSPETQQYFAEQTFEYPLVEGVPSHPLLVPLDQIETPDLDLGSLADLEQTLKLMRDTGVL